MIPAVGYRGQRVGVLGLGRSGMATARSLEAGGATPVCWDDGEAGRAAAERRGYEVADLSKPRAHEDLAALIVSPGIPHLYPSPHPAVTAALAAGVPVDNDVGVFFRSLGQPGWEEFERPPRVVAVTGSNGKSTTSALIAHVLKETGVPVRLGGNIGRGVLDLEPPVEGAVYVLELSSYQTELARSLTPDVAVFTNLSPDHLDRHGGHGGYFAAKRRLFAEGGPDHAVIGVDEAEGQFLAGQLAEGPADTRAIRISSGQKLDGPGWSVFVRKGFLAEYRKGRQAASIDLRGLTALAGAHNHQNVCAAWGALRALGVGPRAIAPALESFEGLAHRSQVVATRDGVTFINDSKATNPASAGFALRAHAKVRWICGGQIKDGGLEGLGGGFEAVAKAYVIGEDAAGFAALLGDLPHEICMTMERAVARAAEDAAPGEVVLLAPAAASFDQYPDFEARGDDFVASVSKAMGEGGGQG